MSAIQQLLTDHIDIWTAAETEKKTGRGRVAGSTATVYGIKKLRELVLELAVQGRLLPRNTSWKNLKLSDLGSWAIGSGFPTSEQGHLNEDIFFVKVSDMNLDGNEKFIHSANNTISEVTANRLRINVHSPGTVIFPKIGGAIATNKRRILTRPTAIDNNCLGLTPKNGISSAWLYLFLNSIDLSKYQVGTSVPALAQGVLKDIPALLPDAAEQDLVVAKVDELMALCDQLEAQHSDAAEAHEQLVSHLLGTLGRSQSPADFDSNWQRIAAHFDTLFTTEASIDVLNQTLLQLAVMGKLVAQDANDEPASELLKRVQAEKKKLIIQGKIKQDKPSAKIEKKEIRFAIPSTWEWVRMADLCRPISSGSTPSAELFRYEKGVPFLKVYNIRNQEIDFEYKEQFIDDSLNSTKLARSILIPGDVVMNIVGPPLGKVAIIPDAYPQWNCNQAIVFFGLIKPINIEYILNYLKEGSFLQDIELIGTAGQDNISVSKSKNILVPVPPLAEQRRIVVKIKQLTGYCDQLRTCVAEANQLQKRLADVLVEHAVVT